METIDTIKARRSIRKFIDKDVSPSHIEQIIEAGLYAPSSKNCRPWQFEALTGDAKNKVIEVIEKSHDSVKYDTPKWIKSDSTLVTCKAMREAPVLIMVYNKGPRSGGEDAVKKDPSLLGAMIAETLSLGASIENMLLAAQSLGLATLWCGDVRNAKPLVEKHMKTKYDIVAGVAVGYPSYTPPPKKI